MILQAELPVDGAADAVTDMYDDAAARTRAMLYFAATTEIAACTFRQDGAALHVDSPYVLLYGQIKKLLRHVFQHASRLGWSLPEESRVEIILNGRPFAQYARPKSQHQVETPTTLALGSDDGMPYILGVCGIDGAPDPYVRQVMAALAADQHAGEKKLIGRTLRQREDYATLFAAMIDGLILCDEHAHILYINKIARKLIGMNYEPRRGTALQPTGLCDLQELLHGAIDEGINQVNKVVNLGDQGKRLLGVNIRQVPSRQGNPIGWLLIIRDITASWQSDRFKSLLTTASHELNTPLASLRNTIDLLIDGETGPVSDTQSRFLEILRTDAAHMQRLLHDLLDVSALDQVKATLDRRRHVRIEYVVKRVLESFEAQSESRGIALEPDIPGPLPSFIGDRDRITQVLMNLVDNAMKYTEMDGRVTVRCSEQEGEIIVAVQDNGCGVPRDKLEVIFDRFSQLENLPSGGRRGFGLGLSIARDIVTAFGGRIWARSGSDEGSTFYFTIPLTGEQSEEKVV